ncbi:energy transducer TonB [Candidatus Palauibacter sp.]|uniref:energy transducer TonB n=1 Tax=Candidatus Palauibacter sp. TaxID=3101350 RepID=UPI003B5942E1
MSGKGGAGRSLNQPISRKPTGYAGARQETGEVILMEGTGIRLTANDRFKMASPHCTRVGLLVAVFLHLGLFVLVQPFEAADMGVVVTEMESINLPPEVRMPPPPEAIQRPEGPPPPAPAAADPANRPTVIPYDTNPVLLNQAEVLRVLEREYPRTLKEAGIEGRVELWLYLTEDGIVEKVEIKTSSGNPLLDEAARKVAPTMTFSPAMNRDRVTAVWVSQWVTFQVN